MASPEDPETLARNILSALASTPRDDIAVNQALRELDHRLADPATSLDAGLADDVLVALKNARRFPQLAKLAERLLTRGDERPRIRHLYAQALIDEGQIIPAIDVLRVLRGSGKLQGDDLSEVQGLLGRAHKQIYVDYVTEKSCAPRFVGQMEEAIRHYGSAYDRAHPAANFWHAGNLLALQHRAIRDELAIGSPADMRATAQRLIAALEPQAEVDKNPPWSWATLGEAHLALRQYDKATECFGRFAQHPNGVDAFALASTIRQLEQVWQLEAGHSDSGPILAGLKAIMAEKHTGMLTLTKAEREAIRNTDETEDECLEGMFPGARRINFGLLRTIVQRAAAVCIIRNAENYAKGTGFLVEGPMLANSLPQGSYILTNAHVVSDPAQPGFDKRALKPDQLRVRFDAEAGSASRDYRCAQVVWQSPAGEYDATLFRLTETVANIEPLSPAAQNTLQPDEEGGENGTRLAVVGHPNGTELSVLLAGDILDTNGTLVGMGPRTSLTDRPVYLHYKTPTQPGNSGSPVFETNAWTLVGLHRAGYPQGGRPRLGGQPGRYLANEGVSIHSICSAIKQAM